MARTKATTTEPASKTPARIDADERAAIAKACLELGLMIPVVLIDGKLTAAELARIGAKAQELVDIVTEARES